MRSRCLLYGVKRPVKLGLSDKNAVGNREKSKKIQLQQLRMYLFLRNVINSQAILRPRHNKAYHSWTVKTCHSPTSIDSEGEARHFSVKFE